MAEDTPREFRDLVIYEVFVRNHGSSGTFADVEKDLERIKRMGADAIWMMPIHPIGKQDRKGSLGSPYSIRDYRAINPEFGNFADFTRLTDKAHQLGMKVMIDVVYNHTAHDAIYLREHPEWYHRDSAGRPYTSVPEWSDIIDLAHPNAEMWDYLSETLRLWVKQGVDGFRCDVASLVPIDFWKQARKEVAQVKPGVIWLAESVHLNFVRYRRRAGLLAQSDSEIYQAFDLTYDYDLWPAWRAALAGTIPVRQYLDLLRFQEAVYPANFIKMRCVENHDQPRITSLTRTPQQARAWTAFQAFNKGAFLIYGGQESAAVSTPSLFEADRINWRDYSLQPFLTRLAAIKKHQAVKDGAFTIITPDPAILAAWDTGKGGLLGVFNVRGIAGKSVVPLPDGDYLDLISDQTVPVRLGRIDLPEDAFILSCERAFSYEPYKSVIL